MNTAEHERLVKHAHWVNEIDKDPAFLDHIKDLLTDWEINRLLEHISYQTGIELRRVNETLLLNPTLKYGKDFTIDELEKLRKVKPIVQEWKVRKEIAKYSPPEKLTLVTGLISLKAINRIFRDQLQQWFSFSPIIVNAPFDLVNFASLMECIISKGITSPEIKASLEFLLSEATGNIGLYEKIQDNVYDSKQPKYYFVDSKGDTYAVSTPNGVKSIEENPYKQYFLLSYQLYDFCKQVKDYLVKCLKNPSSESTIQSIPAVKPFYKKHPGVLEFLRIPEEITKRYFVVSEYRYQDIPGYGEIPVPLFALLGAEYHKFEIPEQCFQAYAKGFIEGYNESLVPFIDTEAGRKEKLISETFEKGGSGFKAHMGQGNDVYLPKDFYELGISEGKRYNAWNYVFETPYQFLDYFKPPIEAEKKKDKVPEKWYALYHLILIALGKPVPNLTTYSKADIIKYGKEQYGTGQGFYRAFKDIDLNNMIAFIRSLPPKDKKQWKQIITDISKNDADVVSWLKKC